MAFSPVVPKAVYRPPWDSLHARYDAAMGSRSTALLVVFALAAAGCGRHTALPSKEDTDAAKDGLKGPVRKAVTITKGEDASRNRDVVEYDRWGNRVRHLALSRGKALLDERTEVDSSGHKLKRTSATDFMDFSSSVTVNYAYGADGRLAKVESVNTYDLHSKRGGGPTTSRSTEAFEYGNGRLVKSVTTGSVMGGPSGSEQTPTTYKYDACGSLIEEVEKSSMATRRTVHKYDAQGREVEVDMYVEGMPMPGGAPGNVDRRTYDATGNLTSELHSTPLNAAEMHYSGYKLDKGGNWIERVSTSVSHVHATPKSATVTERRTISYWPTP